MEITSKKEYHLAIFEQEELLEWGSGDLTEQQESRLAELGEAIIVWDKEQNRQEVVELTERYWIEVTDRTDFVVSVVQILLEHPCIVQTPELAEKTQRAQDLLFEVYQACSSKY